MSIQSPESMTDVADAFRNVVQNEVHPTELRRTAGLCITLCEAAAREDAEARWRSNHKLLKRGVEVLRTWLYPEAADYLTQWLADHPPVTR
jgi:hypothetical protein